MTTESKLPGIPFDASKPEDLARLKAGWPLVQRDGTKFEGKFLGINEKAPMDCVLIFALDDGSLWSCSTTGRYAPLACDSDIFFASNKVRKSKWVAVVKSKSGFESTWTADTKDGLLSAIEIGGSSAILSGPTELPWEEDAPLPPAEQPKAGWYVGPFATQEIAMVNTHRTPTYGTLTEVQL